MPARCLLRAGATGACALALACCSCDESSSASPGGGGSAAADGGNEADSAAEDGGATSDASDAKPDQDASADADAWVTDPDAWEPASWNPPGCQILRAKNLSKALPSFGWLDCANGIAGCVFLDTSGLPGIPGNLKLFQTYDVRSTTSGTLFTLNLVHGKTDHGAGLFDTSGPLAAWRSDATTNCVVDSLVLGEDDLAALRASQVVDGGVMSTAIHGSRALLIGGGGSKVLIDESVTGNSLAGLARVQLSKSIMALEVGVSPFVYTWDYSAAKPQLIPRPPDVQEDYGAIVRGSEVVFMRDSTLASARAFAVRHADGKVENLFQKPSVWPAFLTGDGTDFCWQELGQNDAGPVLEVWKAAFTTVPSNFKPQKLATLAGAGNFVLAGLAGGYWVYRMDDATLRAIRVSDGKHLDVPAPKGFGWITPFGVVNGEIWSLIHVVPGTDANAYSVARVPLGSLGPPL